MTIYEVSCVKTHLNDEFGINAFNDGKLVKSVDRITDCKEDMEHLADLCNNLEIELCHLDDIIEDYLTDFCI